MEGVVQKYRGEYKQNRQHDNVGQKVDETIERKGVGCLYSGNVYEGLCISLN